jgi:predicted nucleic acid-binding protein
MTFVLDASVACAWVLEDEMTPALYALREQVATTRVCVPSLWRYEVMNVLIQASRRGRIRLDDVPLNWSMFQRLHVEQSPYEPSIDEIVRLCTAYQLTAYDAHYLALARSLDCPLATLDQRLADAARAEGVAVLGLAEYE